MKKTQELRYQLVAYTLLISLLTQSCVVPNVAPTPMQTNNPQPSATTPTAVQPQGENLVIEQTQEPNAGQVTSIQIEKEKSQVEAKAEEGNSSYISTSEQTQNRTQWRKAIRYDYGAMRPSGALQAKTTKAATKERILTLTPRLAGSIPAGLNDIGSRVTTSSSTLSLQVSEPLQEETARKLKWEKIVEDMGEIGAIKAESIKNFSVDMLEALLQAIDLSTWSSDKQRALLAAVKNKRLSYLRLTNCSSLTKKDLATFKLV
ncbi:MAG: hypothetical protein ACYC2U_07725, partial [Candidatus Amoebophilus sp.]